MSKWNETQYKGFPISPLEWLGKDLYEKITDKPLTGKVPSGHGAVERMHPYGMCGR